MKLLAIIGAVSALVRVTSSSPRAHSIATTPPSSDPSDYKHYYLRTKLLPGQKHKRFDGLYVQLYHTGAGLDDAVVTKNKSETVTAYLNGTKNLFNVPEAAGQAFSPWGTFIEQLSTYAGV